VIWPRRRTTPAERRRRRCRDASGDQAGTGCAVVNVRVMKVGLNGPDRDAVVEGGKDVVEADAAGDAQPQVQGWKMGPPTLAPPPRTWPKGTKRFF